MRFPYLRLADLCSMTTGKLDSNAAIQYGEYPFFTCARETYKINNYAFDTEAVLLGGNNANGIFPLKYNITMGSLTLIKELILLNLSIKTFY
jgi:type I restriction enzyme S subunit